MSGNVFWIIQSYIYNITNYISKYAGNIHCYEEIKKEYNFIDILHYIA